MAPSLNPPTLLSGSCPAVCAKWDLRQLCWRLSYRRVGPAAARLDFQRWRRCHQERLLAGVDPDRLGALPGTRNASDESLWVCLVGGFHRRRTHRHDLIHSTVVYHGRSQQLQTMARVTLVAPGRSPESIGSAPSSSMVAFPVLPGSSQKHARAANIDRSKSVPMRSALY